DAAFRGAALLAGAAERPAVGRDRLAPILSRRRQRHVVATEGLIGAMEDPHSSVRAVLLVVLEQVLAVAPRVADVAPDVPAVPAQAPAIPPHVATIPPQVPAVLPGVLQVAAPHVLPDLLPVLT